MGIETASESALAQAVRTIGSQSAFARLVGCNQSTVHGWLRGNQLLPPKHVLVVEAATRISRHDLRPDIYPRTDAAAPAQPATSFESAR